MLVNTVVSIGPKISLSKIVNQLLSVKLCETTVFILLFGLLVYEFLLYDFNIEEYISVFI